MVNMFACGGDADDDNDDDDGGGSRYVRVCRRAALVTNLRRPVSL